MTETTTNALEQELLHTIRSLTAQRGTGPAVMGPYGMEAEWVQRECETMTYVANEIRTGMGQPDLSLDDIRAVEYRASTSLDSASWETLFAAGLAALILDETEGDS